MRRQKTRKIRASFASGLATWLQLNGSRSKQLELVAKRRGPARTSGASIPTRGSEKRTRIYGGYFFGGFGFAAGAVGALCSGMLPSGFRTMKSCLRSIPLFAAESRGAFKSRTFTPNV